MSEVSFGGLRLVDLFKMIMFVSLCLFVYAASAQKKWTVFPLGTLVLSTYLILEANNYFSWGWYK